MKNEKGFTLVEVLAVIAILIMIITIITPKVFRQFHNAEEVSLNTQINAFINISKIYMSKNSSKFRNENDIFVITYNDLKLDDLVNNDDILNPKTKEPINGCVMVQYENNKYKYTYIESENMCNRALTQVTSGDGIYASKLEPLRLVYRGSNPNNYIWLDENGDTVKQTTEIYRIISFESDGTIKVIRNESIGNIAWDSNASSENRKNENNTYCNYTGTYYGCNVWGSTDTTRSNGSSLPDIFNYKYYQNSASTSLINSGNSGTVTQDSSLNTYLNNAWLNSTSLKDYIETHDFNVGGVYYTSSYTGGDKGLQKEKSEEKLYTWNGKIGLMNITDYVETSLNPTCTSVYSNFYYNTNYYYESSQHITGYDNWPCSNRTYNWLPKAITEWSLSPHSSNRNYVWSVRSAGYFNTNSAASANGVRPAFYLKQSLTLSGEGTSTNPYKINVD